MASVVGCLVLLVLTTAVEPRYAKVMHENYILRPSSFLRGDSLLLAESPKRERRIGLDSTKLLLSNLNLRGGGLLITGEPLDWEESLQYLPYVREHGVLQFIHTFNANKNRSGEKLLWGEELEYGIMKLKNVKRLHVNGNKFIELAQDWTSEREVIKLCLSILPHLFMLNGESRDSLISSFRFYPSQLTFTEEFHPVSQETSVTSQGSEPNSEPKPPLSLYIQNEDR